MPQNLKSDLPATNAAGVAGGTDAADAAGVAGGTDAAAGSHGVADAVPGPIPAGLIAPGTAGQPFEPVLPVDQLPPGALRRVSRGDLDVLLAHTSIGIFAVDDRCPHMAAPLSIGQLDGCVIACPLHNGRFDLGHGGVVRMPTTGGLDPDGHSHPTWSPPGSDPKPEPLGKKAEARRLTRVRRFRYYPVRVLGGQVEVAFPE